MSNTSLGVALDAHPETSPFFIEFLLDETGSMGSCLPATKAGFNNFVESQRGTSGQCYLTLAKFDSSGVKVPYENLDINMVPSLSFFPGSMTNLYDCIGSRLTSILDSPREGRILFVIMTDGGDNASSSYNCSSTRTLIERAQNEGVVVVYLGPSNDALRVGRDLGIPEGNIKPFDTSNMEETMNTVSAATTAFRAGSTSDANFFN
jgi:hypothetical protein